MSEIQLQPSWRRRFPVFSWLLCRLRWHDWDTIQVWVGGGTSVSVRSCQCGAQKPEDKNRLISARLRQWADDRSTG